MRQSFHILTLIAFLGSVSAPACGFSWGGKFSVIEICTSQGIETRVVDNGQAPDNSPNHKTTDKCPFCFASATLTGFLPDAVTIEALNFSIEKFKFDLYETIILSRTANNLSARDPPVLS